MFLLFDYVRSLKALFSMTPESTSSSQDTRFFGHPIGLKTLLLTEMWERMSYYGMRAMLIFFMIAAIQDGGLGVTLASAASIYGLYTGFVYLMGLPGGWIADRLIGGRKAIWYGGIIIMLGHMVLAIPNEQTFFIGLVLVVLGTGLLKPNIGALVGQMYSSEDNRRDSGYTLYYLGINIGALIGYTVCGYLRVNIGWHWAFGAAAVGMGLGLIQFYFTSHQLEDVGAKPTAELSNQARKLSWAVISIFLVLLVIITSLLLSGSLSFNALFVADSFAVFATSLFFICFFGIFFFGNTTPAEKKNLGALLLVCIASVFFWMGFEQAGSSLNLFGQDYTQRMIGSFEIPPEWLQSTNSIFIILLSPFIAALWINLAKRLITPSYGLKCALGLVIMASGFLVMFFAAQIAASGLKVAPYWLIATYFLHTVGELCLSPVALSAVSKLSPKRFSGQLMGIFVLTYAIGNVLAGRLAGNFDPSNLQQMPDLYLHISLFTIGVGVVVYLATFKTKKWEKAAD
jgi:POT family proton-dependent oligopeptide transporter